MKSSSVQEAVHSCKHGMLYIYIYMICTESGSELQSHMTVGRGPGAT
uniref:Uncharacterized protein n=1 Tax=Anguilla anguilla TaxID=7936 RepID=A0A0E9WQG8_ANGAN